MQLAQAKIHFTGLFMGVSMLSLIEILYYITLRPACNNHNQTIAEVPIDNSRKCESDCGNWIDSSEKVEHANYGSKFAATRLCKAVNFSSVSPK